MDNKTPNKSKKTDKSAVIDEVGVTAASDDYGKQSAVLPKKIKPGKIFGQLIVLVILVIVGGLAIYSLQRHSHKTDDKALQARYNKFMGHETDCGKFLQEFGNAKATNPAISAQVLETQVNCSVDQGRYDQALQYVNKLSDVYKVNPSLKHYVDTGDEVRQIKALKAQPQTADHEHYNGNNNGPVGRQKDGRYVGP